MRVESEATTEHAARASDLANRVDVLKKMPLFKHLTYKEIMRLLNVLVVKDYKAGERIIEEKTDGEELFIILSGKVKLHKDDAFITHLERGAHFGEMALVDRSKRSASATAEEHVARAHAPAARLLRDHPQRAGRWRRSSCGASCRS